MTRPYITINREGQLTVDDVVATSLEDVKRLAPNGAMCSSSVDFPEDFTNDPAVISLCGQL